MDSKQEQIPVRRQLYEAANCNRYILFEHAAQIAEAATATHAEQIKQLQDELFDLNFECQGKADTITALQDRIAELEDDVVQANHANDMAHGRIAELERVKLPPEGEAVEVMEEAYNSCCDRITKNVENGEGGEPFFHEDGLLASYRALKQMMGGE